MTRFVSAVRACAGSSRASGRSCRSSWRRSDSAGSARATSRAATSAARRAAEVGARLVARVDPAEAERLEDLLHDRPLALEEPAPALTALTNRVVAYLERRP